MVSRNLFKKAKLVKNDYITTNKSKNSFNNFIQYSQNFLNPQYITGVKLQISGQLSNRKAASRTRVVRKSIDILSLNSNNSLIDTNKFSFKGKMMQLLLKFGFHHVNQYSVTC